MNTFEKMLAVLKMQEADQDDNVSFDDFFKLVNSYGRDREKESAHEFIMRFREEAIAEADILIKEHRKIDAFRDDREYQSVSDPVNCQQIIDDFHNLYYHDLNTWPKNTFLGVPIQQNPIDMYLYQELIFKTRPSCIIQTGIADGGSLLYFATLMDLIGVSLNNGCVIGIDKEQKSSSAFHPRVFKIYGDSAYSGTADIVRSLLSDRKASHPYNAMVSLDSDHSYGHVLSEMVLYSPFVGIGQYMVVEDTNINGHPVYADYGPGPLEAVEEFLKDNKNFVRDDNLWKRQLMSHHQYGWLKRIS